MNKINIPPSQEINDFIQSIRHFPYEEKTQLVEQCNALMLQHAQKYAWKTWKRATEEWYKNHEIPYDTRGEKATFLEWWDVEVLKNKKK